MGSRKLRRLAFLVLMLSSLGAAPFTLAKTRASQEQELATWRLEVRDQAGSPLIARVRLEPVAWTERVRLGSVRSMSRSVPASGVELTLPPGAYRAFVSRGPEWSLSQHTLELEAGAHAETRAQLQHQVALPGSLGADLHVHTTHSEDARERGGVRSVDLEAEGLAMAVATDHNHVGSLGAGMDSLAGAEITTWDPEVGHFNAFPLRRLPRWKGTTPGALFAELRKDRDVFVQINHPRLDDHIAFFTLGEFDGRRFKRAGFSLEAHGLEVWNGYQLASPRAVRKLLAEWRAWLTSGHRLTATGGSDSHGGAEHLPGYPRTYARVDRGGSGLARALQRGAAFVTNGPLLDVRVNGAGPGEQADVGPDGMVRVELTLLAADWLEVEQVELWAGEHKIWSRGLPRAQPGRPLKVRIRQWLSVARAPFLHAVARGGRGLGRLLGRNDVEPFAFTNPVYLRHDAVEQVRD